MGTNECSQSASKSSWDSQDFGDVNMVLKWPIFASPLGHNELSVMIVIKDKINWMNKKIHRFPTRPALLVSPEHQ